MRRSAIFATLWTLVAAGGLMAQVPPEERIPVTDPERLERMGFPRDARNVFEWSKRDRGDSAMPGDKAAETWGTRTGFTTVLAMELQSQLSDSKFQRNPAEGAFCVDAALGGAYLVGQVQLPEGASLGVLNSWAFDPEPDRDLYFWFYETCLDYGYGDPVTTLVAENQTLGAIGNIPGSKSLGGLTVDNHRCAYFVKVEFAGLNESCAFLGIRKFEITWNRQVSPPPATATFNDVPTNHPFFQFVEALAKSGITAGCGLDSFCPDAPLTRGQMAVFLAKALGLQWP